MAALQPTDYGVIREQLYRAGFGKEELKALAALPSQAQLTAAFQVLEDFWESNRASVKTSIDGALGVTTSAALARKVALAWLIWKVAKGNN